VVKTGGRRRHIKWNIYVHIIWNYTYTQTSPTFLACYLWPYLSPSLAALQFCNMLCTSGLVDYVIFLHNGPYGTGDASSMTLRGAERISHKLANRPGFSGTVPVWDTLSRNPERCLKDAQMSRFSCRRPGRDRTQST